MAVRSEGPVRCGGERRVAWAFEPRGIYSKSSSLPFAATYGFMRWAWAWVEIANDELLACLDIQPPHLVTLPVLFSTRRFTFTSMDGFYHIGSGSRSSFDSLFSYHSLLTGTQLGSPLPRLIRTICSVRGDDFGSSHYLAPICEVYFDPSSPSSPSNQVPRDRYHGRAGGRKGMDRSVLLTTQAGPENPVRMFSIHL